MELAPAPTPTPTDPADRPTALVTGSNGGIGLALAHDLADAGWRVLLHGRDPDKLGRARTALGVGGPHEAFRADLATPAGPRDLSRRVVAATHRLDVLVHNAGGLTPQRRTTDWGVEQTMAVNAVAPYALTESLRPLLESTAAVHGGARVVTVASEAHRFARLPEADPADLAEALRQPPGPYIPIVAYFRAKLAAMAWTLELARRLEGTAVTANACHPGLVRTAVFDGMGLVGSAAKLFSALYLSPETGAEAPFRLATAPEYGERTGRYVVRSFFTRPHEAKPSKAARTPANGAVVWEALSRAGRTPGRSCPPR
jgi:NAD(P)-dependent dehydrogenase (short-subunit alcohol dehydrogenase family)